MTIHHDKLGYGKLASSQEDISEDRIAEMLKMLNGEVSEDGKGGDKPAEDKKKEEKK